MQHNDQPLDLKILWTVGPRAQQRTGVIGQSQGALGCFHRMRSKGIFPDVNTYACILKTCGTVRDSSVGNDGVLGIALIDLYSRRGVLEKAQKELSVQNVVSWNVLIVGYGQQGGLESPDLLLADTK
ncbi:hypothetical protein GOP47_0027824 [Adiantum capillus-veneris]|nr:hypothetical protein GOP47_0027824 [Adiantum capillus-veneris]